MKTPRRFWLLTALGLTGFGLSLELSRHFYQMRNGTGDFKNYCTFGSFDCNAVASSRFAEIFWGIPLSAAAAGWMLAIAILSLLARDTFKRREHLRGLFVLTAGATAFSLFYFGVMAVILKTFCLLCIGIDVVSILSLAIVISLKPEKPLIPSMKTEIATWRFLSYLVSGSLVAGMVFSLLLGDDAPSQSDAEEAANRILATPVEFAKVDATTPSWGPIDAKVTIVKFSDFQCPACRFGAYSLHSALHEFKNQVRLVLKQFPLDSTCNRMIPRSLHAHACEAARIAVCAHRQNMLPKLYEAFFDNQIELAAGHATTLATREGGLNGETLATCLATPEAERLVAADIEEGISLNVRATPTFIINGHRVEGGAHPRVWKIVLEKLLAGK